MNTIAAYTPLECLLLFQSLVALGTDDEDFIHISELLKKSSLIRDGPSYDSKRLEANALRELCLKLLRDDLKSEGQDGFEESNLPPSRKRKIPSPTLPPVLSPRQYKHKLPVLVDRLYARYRDYMIKAIEEDERKYAKIQGQIDQIERGDWDGRILTEDGDLENENINISSAKKNGIPSESLNSDIELVEEVNQLQHHPIKASLPRSSTVNESKNEGPLTRFAQNGQEALSSPTSRTENTRSGSLLVPLRLKNGSSQAHRPNQLKPSQQPPGEVKREPRYSPSARSSQQQQCYSLKTPISSQTYASSSRGSFSNSSARSQAHAIVPSSPSRPVPSHGVLVPPSTGIRSPGMPLDALADVAAQQHRAPSTTSTPNTNSASRQNLEQNVSIKRPNSNEANHRKKQQATILPKPQRSYSGNSKQAQLPNSQSLIQSENKQYSSPYNTSQGLRSSILSHLLTPGPNVSSKPFLSFLDTPTSNGPHKLITGSGTSWTPEPTGSTPRNPVPLAPPLIEPLSPILKPIKIPPVRKPAKKQEKLNLPASSPQGSRHGKLNGSAPTAVASSRKIKPGMSHVDKRAVANQLGDNKVKDEASISIRLEKVSGGSKKDDSTLANLSKPGPPSQYEPKRKRERIHYKASRPPSTILWTRAFPRISAQALQDISTDKNASMFANPIKEKDAPGYRTIILRPQDLKSIRSAITAGHRAATAAAPEDLNPNATSAWLPISEDIIPPKGIINYAQLEKELMRMFANAIMFNPDPRRGIGPAWQDAVQRSKEEALGYAFDEDSVVKGTKDMFAAVEKKVSDLRSVERRSKEDRDAKLLKFLADNQDDDLEVYEESHSGGNVSVMKKRRKA